MCFLYFCYIHKTFLKILIKEAEPMSHPWRSMQYTVAVPNKRERDSLNVTVLSHHVLESMAAAISCRWQFLCYLCKGWYCFSYARVDVQQVSPLSDPLSILATVMCGSSNSADYLSWHLAYKFPSWSQSCIYFRDIFGDFWVYVYLHNIFSSLISYIQSYRQRIWGSGRQGLAQGQTE